VKALARLALAGLAAGLAASVALGAAPPKGWQTLASGTTQGVFPIGYASGRVWFVLEDARGNDSVVSARVAGSGLSSVVSTSIGQAPWLAGSFIVGSNLVTPQKSTVQAALLASGKVGPAAPLPGDPEGTARTAFLPSNSLPAAWHAAGGAVVGGRTIWAINGQSCPNSGQPHQCTSNGGGLSSLALCCTAAGEASDLTNLLANRTKAGATGLAMGLDSHRRVWVAWLDGPRAHSPLAPVSLKIAQVDPVTLKALSAKTLATTVFSFGSSEAGTVDLACTDSCRVVYENATGVYSWGGDGPATRIWANDRRTDKGAHLVAAGGGTSLRVASYADKVANVPDDGQRLELSRGDARGRNTRLLASVDIPRSLPAGGTHFFYPLSVPLSIVTPTSVVSLELYNNGASSRLLGSVLHG
jgi:hypothetical protein